MLVQLLYCRYYLLYNLYLLLNYLQILIILYYLPLYILDLYQGNVYQYLLRLMLQASHPLLHELEHLHLNVLKDLFHELFLLHLILIFYLQLIYEHHILYQLSYLSPYITQSIKILLLLYQYIVCTPYLQFP